MLPFGGVQTTLREQLLDPLYKKWFATPPKEGRDAAQTPPWYVYVQENESGPWRRAAVSTYPVGYRYIQRHVNTVFDLALVSKRREFRPPVVRDRAGKRTYHLPDAPGHIWCGYCRRMTRFLYFSRHHAIPSRYGNLSGDRRCGICGIRLQAIRRFG
jgi:hypothetical protein